MKTLFIKRLLASAIDYFVVMLYALVLFGITTFLSDSIGFEISQPQPIYGQLIGFFTLTLPVFLYFFLFENSKFQATLGKRMMNIHIVYDSSSPGLEGNVFIRNVLKFLPWEIAHTGVHWLLYYFGTGIEPPFWVWIVLIVPQIIVVGYLMTIYTSRGSHSLYDKVAHTRVRFSKVSQSNSAEI